MIIFMNKCKFFVAVLVTAMLFCGCSNKVSSDNSTAEEVQEITETPTEEPVIEPEPTEPPTEPEVKIPADSVTKQDGVYVYDNASLFTDEDQRCCNNCRPHRRRYPLFLHRKGLRYSLRQPRKRTRPPYQQWYGHRLPLQNRKLLEVHLRWDRKERVLLGYKGYRQRTVLQRRGQDDKSRRKVSRTYFR